MTAAFNVFAYAKNDGGYTGDLRRDNIPAWNLHRALEWAVGKGCDTILVELSDQPASGRPHVIHHFCDDPSCPGGCD